MGEAVRRLRGLGLRPVMLTGDHETVARRVGTQVGIEDVVAGVSCPLDIAPTWDWRRAFGTRRRHRSQ